MDENIKTFHGWWDNWMQRLIHFPVYSKRDRKHVRNEVKIKGLGQEREGGVQSIAVLRSTYPRDKWSGTESLNTHRVGGRYWTRPSSNIGPIAGISDLWCFCLPASLSDGKGRKEKGREVGRENCNHAARVNKPKGERMGLFLFHSNLSHQPNPDPA